MAPALDSDGEDRLASAHALAAALTRGDFVGTAALFSDDAALWTSAGDQFRACAGREGVVRALERIVARERPTRIRVLRNGVASAVLAAFAGDEALWSIEITIEQAYVDGLMVWFPVGSPALACVFA